MANRKDVYRGCRETVYKAVGACLVAGGTIWALNEGLDYLRDAYGNQPPSLSVPNVIENAALTPGAVHATQAEATRAAELGTPTPDR